MGAFWARARGYQPVSRIRISHLTRGPDCRLSVSSPSFTLYLLKLKVVDLGRDPLISPAELQGLSRFLQAHSIPLSAKLSRRRFETEFRHQSMTGGRLSEASQAYRAFLLTTILSSPHLTSPIQTSLVSSLQFTSVSAAKASFWGRFMARRPLRIGIFDRIFVRHQDKIVLTPQVLRRSWSSPKSGELDRAHILSLSLTCQLWRLVHGHDRISIHELNQLRLALSRPNNCLITSHHVNRGLHVKYDNEILKQLTGTVLPTSLTWGARNRVHMISDILVEMQRDFPDLVPFIRASRQKLKRLH